MTLDLSLLQSAPGLPQTLLASGIIPSQGSPGTEQISLIDQNLLTRESLIFIGHLLLQMSYATLLGATIAFHPKRLRPKGDIDWEMKKTQILICLAGAMLVLIIGDSLALAFGLVGLGSFIRFRTAVSNPLEVAVLFVLIVIGMACGLGFLWMATVSTVFVFILIYVLNLRAPQYQELWELKTQGGISDNCRRRFESLAVEQGYRIARLNLNLNKNVFTCRFRPTYHLHVPEVDQRYRGSLNPMPDAVQWNRLE